MAQTETHSQNPYSNDLFNNFFEAWRSWMDKQHTHCAQHQEMLKQHHKNIEAFAQWHAVAAECTQSLAQLQTDYLQEVFQEMASYVKEHSQNIEPHNLGHHQAAAHHHLNRLVEHGNKMAQVLTHSNRKMYEAYAQRFSPEHHKDS